MFDPSPSPRVFALPPGVDFARALVEGLRSRMQGQAPHEMARVQLIVNTRRAARRLRHIFDTGPPGLLPRIGLLTDLGENQALPDLPDPVPQLRRRLELMKLVSALIARQPGLAPASSAFDLAQSLAALMDEMHGEGVSPDVIAELDVSDQSGHWERIRAFLSILRPYFDAASLEPDVEARQRMVVEALTARWEITPPAHPIILAGSTGSRGATQLLMRAVAKLPQGAVVLPGFDFDMPASAWAVLRDRLGAQDHPQYRFHALLQGLEMGPDQVQFWSDAAPACPARNRLLSLALRPAPVTDQWLVEGPERAADIAPATRGITLLEAPTPRLEALAIAMALRTAAEEGRSAALITPDRTLTRQVAAALDRWSIRPDDSAGVPLHLSPEGRFLRHVAELVVNRLTAESLLTLLKHPLTHRGAERGNHLRLTRELELHLRRHGPPYPDADPVTVWTESQHDAMAVSWGQWLTQNLCAQDRAGTRPLAEWVSHHIALAERIAVGSQPGAVLSLWDGDGGIAARQIFDELHTHANAGGDMTARDYAVLIGGLLSAGEVRNPLTPHPNVLIWGTLEARVQSADLIILAGLNEGTWPETPTPDPWLNRALRLQAGLLLPERRIGLSAHDFQQAAASGDVWLSRSLRSDEAEAVPSRWLNRLHNLLRGLPGAGGPEALDAMRQRGQHWLDLAAQLEAPGRSAKARRIAPCPPSEARPTALSVTEIQRLIRDPYSIYARHILRLRPLDPLMREPDALLRGIVLHKVLELFIRETCNAPERLTRERLMALATQVISEEVPWASARALWLARLDRVADIFITGEHTRRAIAHPAAFETRGRVSITEPPFTLSATADRIDLDAAGNVLIYDYKTGTPPSARQQSGYDKQLLLEAVIAEQAGFGEIGPSRVVAAQYISLNKDGKVVPAPLDEEPPARVWAEFCDLIRAYADPEMGYVPRRAMHKQEDHSDYDHLARFGEWDITDAPEKVRLP